MNVELDHVIWGCSDLEIGRKELAARFGQVPSIGGRHLGFGTWNALLGLEGRAFLEILAPDPKQDGFQGFGRFVESLEEPRMVSWAGRCDDLEALARHVERAGLKAGPIRDLSRSRPDGSRLSWRLMTVEGHSFGGLFPFFIQWLDAHPCDRLEVVGSLRRLRLLSPAADELERMVEILGLGRRIEVENADRPLMEAFFELPDGSETAL